MYSTCLHCHGALGANDQLEPMPVGRRLAFDARKGRLWVVCPRCARWNLTPLEERWEAVESCERLFRGTRLRVSTDNVGLSRVAGGLELVRIGEPLRPEMAAWRYGTTVQRRRRGYVASTVGGLSAIYGMSALGQAGLLGAATGVGAILPFVAVLGVTGVIVGRRLGQWRPRILLPDGRVRRLRVGEWNALRLRPDDDAWALQLESGDESVALRGQAGERALRAVIASANSAGGAERDVADAVALQDASGGSERFLARVAHAAEREQVPNLAMLPTDLRLAIEMALHEDAERRALEGELAALETEWRVAEEIARIADDLLLPDAVRARLATAGEGDAR